MAEKTIPLADLAGHISDAHKAVADCMASDDEEPEVNFGAVRCSLQSALKLLGEESGGGTAQDSARRPKYNYEHNVSAVFPIPQ
jgi:hypothetical protein